MAGDEFNLDFRDAEQKRYDSWKEGQLCVTCFTRKPSHQFREGQTTCKDCEDE